MDFMTFCRLDEIVANYTEAYMFGNSTEDLSVQVIANVTEDDKERILNDFDQTLPYGMYFQHEYENGKLKVLFKEI